MNKFTRKFPQTLASGVAATVLGVSALAASGQVMADDRYAVAYTPEQISSDAGMQTLLIKIRSVANEACPSYTEARSLREVALCRADVQKDLVAKINVPAFTAFVEQSQKPGATALLASADSD